MRIAPEADIFVARVAKTPEDLGDVENVANAIEWAQRECKADLISMSFGYTKDHLPISKAIRSAINDRDESVVFFAAAANSGANATELFPARHESVISIRGTSSNGYIADFNPPLNRREHVALATLGTEVPSEPLSSDVSQKPSVKSGTSIATAISVGIAGLLLTYVNRQSGRQSYNGVKSRLHTRRGMLAMLENISTPSIHRDFLYIKPWCLEGLPADTLWARFEATLLGSGE
ncbi:hypothetical protein PG996_009168 [Apiospora saccharicola]|uniref:Peptidase S8/S53 domain-containing protein n=1 Tax=Apiospora saccharicola TaxID=335842 RepID=A0ABR1UMW6_9PEZI